MSEQHKIRISEWISFAIGALTILLRVAKEIVEIIPVKKEL